LLTRLDSGAELTSHYVQILSELSNQAGLLGLIFKDAQNRITIPVLLRRVINLINEEIWLSLESDVKGDLYESLLERNAQDVKSGAGQYFTPRPLIDAIVDVMQPSIGQTIADPACGTGGFLLAAYQYLADPERVKDLSEEQDTFLRERTFYGVDIVPGVVRLCAMNLYLHGLEMPSDTHSN
jgi:type I restriction enzyme M protein